VLLANAYDELRLKTNTVSRFPTSCVLEFDSKNEEYLKEALRALITCLVEWNVLGKIARRRDHYTACAGQN
jgi:hypothetical protein